MAKYIVVMGCQVTTAGAGVEMPGVAQITTPPSTTCMIDNKGIYAGTLSVVVTGFTDTNIAGGSGSGTITSTSTSTMADNQPVTLEGDQGTAILSGVHPVSGAPVSGYVVTVKITLPYTPAGTGIAANQQFVQTD